MTTTRDEYSNLYQAVKAGDLDEIRKLYRDSFSAPDKQALFIAALLPRSTAKTSADAKLATPLEIIQYLHEEKKITLLQLDAEIPELSGIRMFLIHIAAFYGDQKTVEYFITKKLFHVNQQTNDNSGFTPFVIAAIRDHLELCKYLLSMKATYDYSDGAGKTLQHITANRDASKVLQFLIQTTNQIDLNNIGETPLHSAVNGNAVKCVQYLVNEPLVADLNVKRQDGKDALMLANDLKKLSQLTVDEFSRVPIAFKSARDEAETDLNNRIQIVITIKKGITNRSQKVQTKSNEAKEVATSFTPIIPANKQPKRLTHKEQQQLRRQEKDKSMINPTKKNSEITITEEPHKDQTANSAPPAILEAKCTAQADSTTHTTTPVVMPYPKRMPYVPSSEPKQASPAAKSTTAAVSTTAQAHSTTLRVPQINKHPSTKPAASSNTITAQTNGAQNTLRATEGPSEQKHKVVDLSNQDVLTKQILTNQQRTSSSTATIMATAKQQNSQPTPIQTPALAIRALTPIVLQSQPIATPSIPISISNLSNTSIPTPPIMEQKKELKITASIWQQADLCFLKYLYLSNQDQFTTENLCHLSLIEALGNSSDYKQIHKWRAQIIDYLQNTSHRVIPKNDSTGIVNQASIRALQELLPWKMSFAPAAPTKEQEANEAGIQGKISLGLCLMNQQEKLHDAIDQYKENYPKFLKRMTQKLEELQKRGEKYKMMQASRSISSSLSEPINYDTQSMGPTSSMPTFLPQQQPIQVNPYHNNFYSPPPMPTFYNTHQPQQNMITIIDPSGQQPMQYGYAMDYPPGINPYGQQAAVFFQPAAAPSEQPVFTQQHNFNNNY